MSASHGSVAKSVREAKAKYPSDFCADAKCLYRTVIRGTFRPCPKHPQTVACAECGMRARRVGSVPADPALYVCNTVGCRRSWQRLTRDELAADTTQADGAA